MARKAGGDDAGEDSGSLRLDRWLWHARFFRTRSLATAAASGGAIRLNGESARPGRPLRAGDRLEIGTPGGPVEIIVRSLPASRGPAAAARQSYEETPESAAAREQESQRRSEARLLRTGPDGRPGKRDRRRILRLHGRR